MYISAYLAVNGSYKKINWQFGSSAPSISQLSHVA